MREHQIVITLKPEQFAEVQRLSKAAGAKSMGIFVRKTLLAALGLDGAKNASKEDLEKTKIIADGLRRMQGEIKLLISDSLSQGNLPGQAMIAPPTANQAKVESTQIENELEAEIVIEEESEDFASDLDDLSVRDPLDDLLDRPLLQRLQAYLHAKDDNQATENSAKTEDEKELTELQAQLPDTSGAGGKKPPSAIPRKNSPPLSGGPPPKKPQN